MPQAESNAEHTVVPFSRFQRQMIDWMELMHRRHTVHGLLEVDVTYGPRRDRRRPRRAVRSMLSTSNLLLTAVL